MGGDVFAGFSSPVEMRVGALKRGGLCGQFGTTYFTVLLNMSFPYGEDVRNTT